MSTDSEPDFYSRKYMVFGAVATFVLGLLRWSTEKLRHLSEDTLTEQQSWCPTSPGKKDIFSCLDLGYICNLKTRNHTGSETHTLFVG